MIEILASGRIRSSGWLWGSRAFRVTTLSSDAHAGARLLQKEGFAYVAEVVGEAFSFNELMRRDFWGLPMHGLGSHCVGYSLDELALTTLHGAARTTAKVWMDKQIFPASHDADVPSDTQAYLSDILMLASVPGFSEAGKL